MSLAIAGCSSSDLDDLCKRAGALGERRDQPASDRVKDLFEGWKPESRQGIAIKSSMIRDGEIASYGVFKKLVDSKASTAWSCPAIEKLMVEPVVDDATQLCTVAGQIVASEVDTKTLSKKISDAWTPTSTWGTIVHEALRQVPADELNERITKSYSDETGRTWSCPALEALVKGARRRDLEAWCELATGVEKGPTGEKPIHLRRAKMQQLTGESLSFSLAELRAQQADVGADRCPPLERLLGLVDEARTIDAAGDTDGGGG